MSKGKPELQTSSLRVCSVEDQRAWAKPHAKHCLLTDFFMGTEPPPDICTALAGSSFYS